MSSNSSSPSPLSTPARQLRRPLRFLLGKTVRTRLTVVYGSLFLALGAVLLFTTALLWEREPDAAQISGAIPARILQIASPGNPPHTFVNGTAVARQSAVIAPPATRNAVVALRKVGVQLQVVATDQRTADLHNLLFYSGIALAIAALLGVGFVWLTTGRVLRPLRTISASAQEISASNLHERLDLRGPKDELRVLGDTIDQLLERLERSFEAQRRFVANAAHELRTPIATMRASIDVATAKPGPIPEQTLALASRLEYELDNVEQLLESFLDLARAEQRGDSGREAISLSELVHEAVGEHQPEIAALGLVVDAEGPAAMVEGNRMLLSSMVDNLVDNAVRHNVRGGTLRVRTGEDDDTVSLEVENGGEVIDDDVRGLLEPFRRIGTERTGSESGFGLGLSIVAAVAESHQGSVVLEAPESGGLRVRVQLPAVSSPEASPT